jgi:hypothetical protein
MPAKSTYLDNAVLAAVLTQTPYTSPSTVYAALYTVAPTAGGGGTEVSGGSYARVAVTFGVPTAGVTSNTVAVNYASASASWGTVVAVGIMDNPSTGHLLYFGNLGTSKTVGIGDTVSFAISALSVTEQ